MYYDKDGKEMELLDWARKFEDRAYKIVKQENVGDIWISTVWLGMDHSFGEGKPLIYETMAFPKKGDWNELGCERYSTLEEAQKGHEVIANKYKHETGK